MKSAEMILVDARAQVKTALEQTECSVPYVVRQRWNVEEAQGAVVTYGEYSNVSTDCIVVDEIVYQVDIWAQDREQVNIISAAVNGAMISMGLKRVYAGADAVARDSSGYLRKTYRFGRKVDKRSMRLVD